jgi:hypothetical protein
MDVQCKWNSLKCSLYSMWFPCHYVRVFLDCDWVTSFKGSFCNVVKSWTFKDSGILEAMGAHECTFR